MGGFVYDGWAGEEFEEGELFDELDPGVGGCFVMLDVAGTVAFVVEDLNKTNTIRKPQLSGISTRMLALSTEESLHSSRELQSVRHNASPPH